MHFTLQQAFRTRQPNDSALENVRVLRWHRFPETDVAWSWWQDGQGKIWLCFPGSAPSSASWLLNLYAGMLPAKGDMISDGHVFAYQLASHPDARTHAGWTAGLFQFLRSESSFMDSLYQTGHQKWIISGHSQGGALAYLTAAYLSQLQSKVSFFPQLQWKVYTSGAPKPGNLWFTRDFMAKTLANQVFSMVINSDWVPLMPVGLQQISSFPEHAPIRQWKSLVRQMPKWKQRLALRYVVARMTRPLSKTSRRYYHWLANTPKRALQPKWPNLTLPEPMEDFDYHSFGTQVILMPDSTFLHDFPLKEGQWFTHHSLRAYAWFFKHTMTENVAPVWTSLSLEGTWQLIQTPEWHRTALRQQPIRMHMDWEKQQLVLQDSCGLGFALFRSDGAGFSISQPFQFTAGAPCTDQLLSQVMAQLHGLVSVHQPDQTSLEWQVSGAEPWIWWRVQP